MQSKKKKINVLSRNVDQVNLPSTLFFTLALLIGTALLYGCGQDINNELAETEESLQATEVAQPSESEEEENSQDINNEQTANEMPPPATEAVQSLESEEKEDSVVRIPCLNRDESEPCQHNPDFYRLSGGDQSTLINRGLDSVRYASLVSALDSFGETVCIESGGQPFLATLDNGSCGQGACVPPMSPGSGPTPTPDPRDPAHVTTPLSATEICPATFNNGSVIPVLTADIPYEDFSELFSTGGSLNDTCELSHLNCTNFGDDTMVTIYGNSLNENQITYLNNLVPGDVNEKVDLNSAEGMIFSLLIDSE